MEIEMNETLEGSPVTEGGGTCSEGWRRFVSDILNCFAIIGVVIRRALSWKKPRFESRETDTEISYFDSISTMSGATTDSSFTITALEDSYPPYHHQDFGEFNIRNVPGKNGNRQRELLGDHKYDFDGKPELISNEHKPMKLVVCGGSDGETSPHMNTLQKKPEIIEKAKTKSEKPIQTPVMDPKVHLDIKTTTADVWLNGGEDKNVEPILDEDYSGTPVDPLNVAETSPQVPEDMHRVPAATEEARPDASLSTACISCKDCDNKELIHLSTCRGYSKSCSDKRKNPFTSKSNFVAGPKDVPKKGDDKLAKFQKKFLRQFYAVHNITMAPSDEETSSDGEDSPIKNEDINANPVLSDPVPLSSSTSPMDQVESPGVKPRYQGAVHGKGKTARASPTFFAFEACPLPDSSSSEESLPSTETSPIQEALSYETGSELDKYFKKPLAERTKADEFDAAIRHIESNLQKVQNMLPFLANTAQTKTNSSEINIYKKTPQNREAINENPNKEVHFYLDENDRPVILKAVHQGKIYHLKLKTHSLSRLEFVAYIPHQEKLKATVPPSKIPVLKRENSNGSLTDSWDFGTCHDEEKNSYIFDHDLIISVKINGKRLNIPVEDPEIAEKTREFIANPRSTSLNDKHGLGQAILEMSFKLLEMIENYRRKLGESVEERKCPEEGEKIHEKSSGNANEVGEQQLEDLTSSAVSLKAPRVLEEIESPVPFEDERYAERTQRLLALKAEREKKMKTINVTRARRMENYRKTFADKFTFTENRFLSQKISHKRMGCETRESIGFVPKNEKCIQVDMDAEMLLKELAARKEDLIEGSVYPLQVENFDIGTYRMDECVAVEKAKKGHVNLSVGKQKVKTKGVPNKHLEKFNHGDDLQEQDMESEYKSEEEETVFGNPEMNVGFEVKPIFVEDEFANLDMRHMEEKPCKVLQKRRSGEQVTPSKNRNRKKRHRTTSGSKSHNNGTELAEKMFNFYDPHKPTHRPRK